MFSSKILRSLRVRNETTMAERDTAEIKEAKTFLQMFIVQCFSVSKLQHES